MKIFAHSFLLLTIGVSCSTHMPASKKNDDRQVDALRHRIAYYPAHPGKSAHIIATLTNTSNKNTEVRVATKGFESRINVKTENGEEYEIFEKEYLDLLQTTTWWNNSVELKAGGTIRWDIPLSSLVTLYGQPVTEKSIRGATMTSGLNASGKIIKSKPILIKKEG